MTLTAPGCGMGPTIQADARNKVLSVANEQEGMMQAVALQNGLIAVMVVEWSFDLIPPSIKLNSLGDTNHLLSP